MSGSASAETSVHPLIDHFTAGQGRFEATREQLGACALFVLAFSDVDAGVGANVLYGLGKLKALRDGLSDDDSMYSRFPFMAHRELSDQLNTNLRSVVPNRVEV